MSIINQPSSTPRPKDGNITHKLPTTKPRSHLNDDVRRDSGLASSMNTTASEQDPDMATTRTPAVSDTAPHETNGQVPAIILNDDLRDPLPRLHNTATASYTTLSREGFAQGSLHDTKEQKPVPKHFKGISTEIPTGELDDVFREDGLAFSRHGSIRLQTRRSNDAIGVNRRSPSKGIAGSGAATNGAIKRSPSVAEKRASQKLRSLYECGDENADEESPIGNDARTPDAIADLPTILSPRQGYELGNTPSGSRPPSAMSSKRASYIKMEPWEGAGGVDDWQDIDSQDVDRYGFIRPRNLSSRVSFMNSPSIPGTPNPATADQQQSSPKPSPLDAVDEGSAKPRKLRRPPPDSAKPYRLSMLAHESTSRVSSRPPSRSTQAPSMTSNRSRMSFAPSFRSLSGSYKTPRNRKFAREAPDMLTSEPGLPDSAAVTPPEPVGAELRVLRARDRRHEAKWDAMAKRTVTSSSKTTDLGGGDSYTFNMSSPKLISRTWKGIPDKWRRPAWHSFLTTSAKRYAARKKTPFVPDSELIERFHVHQNTDYPDDVQIDTDVPRTIGNHLSFHVRYRGGQRLLFRVLHALALEFPAVGYVQGMAALVATLLIYYDDERAFVVACRLWECRGLAKLFSPGFDGLMGELDIFKRHWLSSNKDVHDRLELFNLEPMNYAVKWYLTLFAYSLPFATQLRVWDVFMLLGGGEGGVDGESVSGGLEAANPGLHVSGSGRGSRREREGHEFDVLHAVGAALVDALSNILRGAEFEGAMAVLTGHVPVGRPDVLMRVVRGEWMARGRGR